MIEGKSPIKYIEVISVEMSPEGWKVNYQYRNDAMDPIGTFIGTHENMRVSAETEKMLVALLESLERDIYEHLFSAPPEEKAEQKEEKTFEEMIGVRNPNNITLVDDYDLG